MKKVKKYVCLVNDYASFTKGVEYSEYSYGNDDASIMPVGYFVGKHSSDWELVEDFAFSPKFKVGQKVVCIDATSYLVHGVEYTVSHLHNDGTGIEVFECFNQIGFDCYKSNRFIPATINLELSWESVNALDLILDYSEDCDGLESFGVDLKKQLDKAYNDAIS